MTARLRTFAALLMAALAGPLLVPEETLGQAQSFQLTPIVRRGDTNPDGGRFFDCRDCTGFVFEKRGLNNRGEVIAGADTEGDICSWSYYLISGNRMTRFIDLCRTLDFGRVFLLGAANLN